MTDVLRQKGGKWGKMSERKTVYQHEKKIHYVESARLLMTNGNRR